MTPKIEDEEEHEDECSRFKCRSFDRSDPPVTFFEMPVAAMALWLV
jgi:hypothetical protein